MFAKLQKLAARHPVIGEVRGGRGLFAVVELVSDRASRAPIAPWPVQPEAMQALLSSARDEGVSFGSRGNLLILAPPLVIDEADLDGGARIARPPARPYLSVPGHGAPIMSFRLTYATMFNPPEEMHERFERALATVRARLGATHPTVHRRQGPTRGRDRGAREPDRPATSSSDVFRWRTRPRWKRRSRPPPRLPRLARDAGRRARATDAQGRRRHGGARLRDRGGARAGGRQEPDGGARRGAGDRRFLPRLRGRLRIAPGLRVRTAERPAHGIHLAEQERHAARMACGW